MEQRVLKISRFNLSCLLYCGCKLLLDMFSLRLRQSEPFHPSLTTSYFPGDCTVLSSHEAVRNKRARVRLSRWNSPRSSLACSVHLVDSLGSGLIIPRLFPKCDPILAKHRILDQKNNIGSSHRRADFQYKFVPITLSNPKSRRRQNMNHV